MKASAKWFIALANVTRWKVLPLHDLHTGTASKNKRVEMEQRKDGNGPFLEYQYFFLLPGMFAEMSKGTCEVVDLFVDVPNIIDAMKASGRGSERVDDWPYFHANLCLPFQDPLAKLVMALAKQPMLWPEKRQNKIETNEWIRYCIRRTHIATCIVSSQAE